MSTSIRSAHEDFLVTLLEFYSTLDILGVVEPDSPLRLPPADTCIHPPSIFNADAALAAGYNEEAVAVLSVMPYLDVGRHEIMNQIRRDTYPLSYLGEDMDEGYFVAQRGMLDDEEMPASAIRITWEEGGHGFLYIYDTKTSMLYAWLNAVECSY